MKSATKKLKPKILNKIKHPLNFIDQIKNQRYTKRNYSNDQYEAVWAKEGQQAQKVRIGQA
jgi:hypothetical protein